MKQASKAGQGYLRRRPGARHLNARWGDSFAEAAPVGL
jgi:hypothetical protein